MITYTLGDFIDDNSIDEADSSLYVVRKSRKVLYVGQATRGIGNRWFGAGWNHMAKNFYGQWYGNSPIGVEVSKNLPTSRNWLIDLYSVEDCRETIEEYINSDYVNINVDLAEIALIKKFKPTLNVNYVGVGR